jgi:hypothetical protein
MMAPATPKLAWLVGASICRDDREVPNLLANLVQRGWAVVQGGNASEPDLMVDVIALCELGPERVHVA